MVQLNILPVNAATHDFSNISKVLCNICKKPFWIARKHQKRNFIIIRYSVEPISGLKFTHPRMA